MSDNEMDIDDSHSENLSRGIEHQDVLGKYMSASEVVNKALDLVISKISPNALIVDICTLSDNFINDALSKMFNKPKVEKGTAFPTCISVNNVVGHFSPLRDDKNIINLGDVCKIDIGVHIDGYIAVVAHTVVCGAPIAGRQADVIAAAYTAAECAQQLLKPGNKNSQITEMFQAVAQTFNCNIVQGVLSHQMKRFVIDGNKVIISKTDVEHKVDEVTFEVNDVFAIDIVFSTGEGKPKEQDDKPTIFKRAVDQQYKLKLKTSRAFISEVDTRFPTFPFTVRAFEDEKSAKLGLVECLKHGLLTPYPILSEKAGEFVAHIKFTALITATGTVKITGVTIDKSTINTQCQVTDANLLSLLAQAQEAADALAKKREAKKLKKKAASSSAAAMEEN